MADTTTFGPDGWTVDQLDAQDGKTFVITGANAGVGFQASKILLSKGASVVMLNRSVERSEAAIADLKRELGAGTAVSYVQMDLASLASVREAAAKVLEAVPRIDALICNAAIAQVPSQRLTVDGFESQLGTNTTGTSSSLACSSTGSSKRRGASSSCPAWATRWASRPSSSTT